MKKHIITVVGSLLLIVGCTSAKKEQEQTVEQQPVVDSFTVSVFDGSFTDVAVADMSDADRPTIKAIQTELNTIGYALKPIDGIAGKKTISAIERFQRDFELDVDGKATPFLLEYLQSLNESKDDGVISKVVEIQSLLIQKDYLKGNADGLAGESTRTAVSEYQQAQGLNVDGLLTVGLLDNLRSN